MSFVPVTGPATFRAGEPPREGVVEFTDERRTVALPMRAALPVLTKAHARDDVHPSVGLLAGAALLGTAAGRGRQVRAGRRRAELAGRRRSTPTTRTGSRMLAARARRRPRRRRRPSGWCARCSTPSPTRAAQRAAARPAPAPAPAPADDFASRLQAPAPRGTAAAAPTTGRSWSGSRCGSRPTRRSWSRAPCGWCSRSTTSRTRSTCATPRCSGPSRARGARTGSATGPAPTRRIALRGGGRGLAGARPAARAAGPRRDHPRRRRARQPARGRRRRRCSERGVDVLWPRSLGRDLTARPVLDRGPSGAARGAAPDRAVRPRRAVRLQLAGRPARRAAHRRGDGPAGRRGLADAQAARQLDGHRPRGRPQGPQAAGPHRQARPRRSPPRSPASSRSTRPTATAEEQVGRRRQPAEGARAAAAAPPPASRSPPPAGAAGHAARLPAPRPDLAGRADRRSASAPAWPTTWASARRSP